MEELFKILELPPDTSKEEVRATFLKWKKNQQKILVSGKPTEQKLITEEITRVTVLYKKFVGDSSSSKEDDKKDDEKDDKEKKSPVINVRTNYGNLNKNLIAFTCIFAIFVLGGLAFNSLKDSIRMPSFFKPTNPLASILGRSESDNETLQREPAQQLQRPPKNLPEPPKNLSEPAEKLSEPKEKPVEKSVDKNSGQTPNQRAAIQTLLDFHSGITSKNLRDSYNCLSMGFQNFMSYDGWAPGFDTTVSSEVDNIKIVSEADNEIVLNYVLKATDNIQGKQQVSYFNGTVSIINENGRWKIDNIKNKAR